MLIGEFAFSLGIGLFPVGLLVVAIGTDALPLNRIDDGDIELFLLMLSPPPRPLVGLVVAIDALLLDRTERKDVAPRDDLSMSPSHAVLRCLPDGGRRRLEELLLLLLPCSPVPPLLSAEERRSLERRRLDALLLLLCFLVSS